MTGSTAGVVALRIVHYPDPKDYRLSIAASWRSGLKIQRTDEEFPSRPIDEREAVS